MNMTKAISSECAESELALVGRILDDILVLSSILEDRGCDEVAQELRKTQDWLARAAKAVAMTERSV